MPPKPDLELSSLLASERTTFKICEAAELIGMSARFVEDRFDDGELYGHEHNGRAGKRFSKRIVRESLLGYLVRTANYDSEMRLAMARQVLDAFAPADLRTLRDHISNRLAAD